MWSHTQAGRLLKVVAPLGPDVMLLVGLRGREALSELFHFELDLVAWRHLPLDFHALLGQPLAVDLTLPNGTSRFFHGIVTRLTQGRQDEEFAHYQAVLSPRFWLWTRRIRSRIFRQTSAPEIFDQVLNHPAGTAEGDAAASGNGSASGQSLAESIDVGRVEHRLACVDDTLEAYDDPGAYAKRFDGIGPGGNEQPEELTKVFDDADRWAATSGGVGGLAGRRREFVTSARPRDSRSPATSPIHGPEREAVCIARSTAA